MCVQTIRAGQKCAKGYPVLTECAIISFNRFYALDFDRVFDPLFPRLHVFSGRWPLPMAKRPKPASAPRAAQAADATVSVAGTILRVIGTIFLILLVTGLLFLCIFAYYVKNCLSTDLDVQLSDFTVSLSSSILYEDADGNWQNLTNLSSTENRVWVD